MRQGLENAYPRTFPEPLKGGVHNKILLFEIGRDSFSTWVAARENQKLLRTDMFEKLRKNPKHCLQGSPKKESVSSHRYCLPFFPSRSLQGTDDLQVCPV